MKGRVFPQNAWASGEIDPDLDVEIALDLIYAPVFYRLRMGHAPLSEQFTDNVLAMALKGMASSRRKR
jgi:hypothetical protein